MKKAVEVIFKGLVVAVVVTVILAWPTQWLWNNALVGAIDGINPISFWQALGITFLCNALLKSTVSR